MASIWTAVMPTIAFPVESGGVPDPTGTIKTAFSNEGDGARTRNHRIDSPVFSSKNPSKIDNSHEILPTACQNPPDSQLQTIIETIVNAWPDLHPDQKNMLAGFVKGALPPKG
jgi:hypothetical protein